MNSNPVRTTNFIGGNRMRDYRAEDAVVAFIDILGSSEEMKRDPQNALNTVHNAYNDALEIYNTIFNVHRDKVQIRIFSDNIVLSCPSESIGIEAALHLIVVLSALIQEKLLHYSVLSRGGIARGDFFRDETMIWGNALVQAYNLECAIAIYPRIVIHPSLIADVGYFKKKSNGDGNDLINWITQDQDGLCYVDYFNTKLIKDPLLMLTIFLGDNERRETNHSQNLKVAQKIIWHGNYLKQKIYALKSDISSHSSALTSASGFEST